MELGSGAGGTVYLAHERKNESSKVAIKVIDLRKPAKKDLLLMELKVLFIGSLWSSDTENG